VDSLPKGPSPEEGCSVGGAWNGGETVGFDSHRDAALKPIASILPATGNGAACVLLLVDEDLRNLLPS